jgi:5-methylcytosine-specific restriction enzyme A
MPRSEFSKATKLEAFKLADGCCENCGLKIVGSIAPVIYDHIVPDALGGDNSLDNCQCLCTPCDKLKTFTPIDGDIPRIAKAQRGLERRANVRQKRGRPLPGTKRSGLKKKMDGTVERRN